MAVTERETSNLLQMVKYGHLPRASVGMSQKRPSERCNLQISVIPLGTAGGFGTAVQTTLIFSQLIFELRACTIA